MRSKKGARRNEMHVNSISFRDSSFYIMLRNRGKDD